MSQPGSTCARQIAEAAAAFERRRTGHGPESVGVVLNGDTLVITLHGTLSLAERALAQTPAGADELQEFHRRLVVTSSKPLRDEIRRISGAEVSPATAEGAVLLLVTGTLVLMFLLDREVPADAWSGRVSGASTAQLP